jgi:hypothetical protein
MPRVRAQVRTTSGFAVGEDDRESAGSASKSIAAKTTAAVLDVRRREAVTDSVCLSI